MTPSDDSDPATRRSTERSTNRRAVLRTGAVLGVTGLAGCVDGRRRDATNPSQTASRTPSRSTPAQSETQADDGSPTEPPGDASTESAEDDGVTDDETPTDDSDEWHVRPDGDPATVPSRLVCDEDHEGRFPQRFEESALRWGNDDGHWELRIESVTAEYGETIAVRLTNVSGEEQHHGSRGDFNVQVETDAGWQEVRVRENDHDAATTDELQKRQPGEGPRWELSMSEDELPETYGDMGTVCPGLPSGRYRFVFAGMETSPLGVAFDFAD